MLESGFHHGPDALETRYTVAKIGDDKIPPSLSSHAMEINPYQNSMPQSNWGSPPAAPPTKPTSMTVFGILNIIFGTLGICGTIFAGFALFAQQMVQQNNPAIEMMQASPAMYAFQLVTTALGFVATIVLIIAGIGLLQTKGYGRTLSIGYSIYAMIAGIVGTIFTMIFVVMPMINRIQDVPDGPDKAGVVGGAIGGAVGGVIGGCIGLIYPALLLFFMTRPNVVAACENASP